MCGVAGPAQSAIPPFGPIPPAQCIDGLDNDADGKVDLADPGCVSARDRSEADDPPPPAVDVQALSNQILALDPHVPGNIDLFTSIYANGGQGFYPDGGAMLPAAGPEPTEEEVRADLTAFLEEQFDGDTAGIAEALALFDDDQIEAKIANPTLRAAFAGTNGTLLEPTLNSSLTDKFAEVRYGGLPNTGLIAISSGVSSENRLVVFNGRYRNEDFRYLIGIIGHEFLHDDGENSGTEEAILNALSAMTYLQVLVEHPELAHTGTELSRQMNDLALLFVNSRERFSANSEIVAPTGTGVAPGSPRNEPDLWSIFDGADDGPAPPELGQILVGLGLPAATEFSQATAETFENLNDVWLSDLERLQISVLLRLVTPAEIAQHTGLTKDEVIAVFELGPYLYVQPPAQCADTLDNDGDGDVDLEDTGCASPRDRTEADPPPPPPPFPPFLPECRDGLDNDGDGKIDLADLGCKHGRDDGEAG